MGHYVVLIVRICIESFVASFTVVLKVSCVQLHVTIQVALRRVSFVTESAGISVSASGTFRRHCRSRPFLLLKKKIIYIILGIINRLLTRKRVKIFPRKIINL